MEDSFVYVGFWKEKSGEEVCYKEIRIENPFVLRVE
jgi:hypothetical protein